MLLGLAPNSPTARDQRRAALLEAAPDSDETVTQREDGLGQTDKLI